jgi:hypothetical protein
MELGRQRDAEIAHLKAIVASRDASLADANQKLHEAESTRRKLHNTIQELKVTPKLVSYHYIVMV